MSSWSGLKNATARAARDRVTREAAEALAAEALGFIAADDKRLTRYIALSGIEINSLHAAALQPDFLASVMAYVLEDEQLIVAFAQARSVPPETVVAAARSLGVMPWERGTA